ncbi:MAG: UTP--glucose-1-phosphate uridylyltransferase [Planctomycetota bacterium]
MTHKLVRKAVFPVAGLGTRFLPATKAMPKEMLTVVDRPLIQHVVDEAAAAGIEHFVFVTGRNKAVIEDHFDVQYELSDTLEKRGKDAAAALVDGLTPAAGATSFTRQQRPLGLGHAVWCAREIVGDEPFALILPDVIVNRAGRACLADMISAQNAVGGNYVAVEAVADDLVDRYGIVDVDQTADAHGRRVIRGMVEKPDVGKAPSNLSILGRYVLQPEIFSLLETQGAGAGGEIQVTDAMHRLMESQPFHAVEIAGRSFDCGSKLGFLEANLSFGLNDADVGESLRDAAKHLLAEG